MSPGPRARALALAATLAALVFIVVPASQYFGNLAEFLTGPSPLLRLLLAPALLFVALVLLALRLARATDLDRLCAVLAMLTLLAWAQAYLLVWDYGPLDGSPIDWRTPAWRGWVDLCVWILGLAAALRFHRRLAAPLATAAFVVVALQAGTLAAGAYAQREALVAKGSRRAEANRFDAMPRFSSERNVLHVILDSFQADVFRDILDGPAGPRVRESLAGFTYFEEHLGTFAATYFALPLIVSGQMYRNHVPRPDFVDGVFRGKTILNAAHDAGYEVDLASDPWMLDMLMRGRYDNAYLTAQLPLAEETARLLDLALFRLVPHWLKRAVYNDQRWLVTRLVAPSDLMRFPYFTHNAFLASVAQRVAADRPRPVYKFFHLMTSHTPFVVNPDCAYAGGTLPRVREVVTAQSQCSLAFVLALLERMRQAGVYDNTLIVIMGDHGGHVPPRRYRPGTLADGDEEYLLHGPFVALATPLMLMKPIGATGPLRISPALTSISDTAATIDAELGLGAGLPGRPFAEGPRDVRTVFAYPWTRQDATSAYVGTIMEMAVAGSAYDVASWRIVARHPPPEGR